MPIYLNPIALRMAETLWSFGLSECNRVKYYVLLYLGLYYTNIALLHVVLVFSVLWQSKLILVLLFHLNDLPQSIQLQGKQIVF